MHLFMDVRTYVCLCTRTCVRMFAYTLYASGSIAFPMEPHQGICGAFVSAAASGTTMSCRSSKHISLVNTSGFISSELAASNGIGTSECPLKIQVGPGQRIQLTLMVFTGKRMAEDAEDFPAYQSNACFEIGAVFSPGQTKTLTACGGSDRRVPNLLYLSESNNITIQLHSKYILKELSPFVIKYESKSCAWRYINECSSLCERD